MSSLTLSSPLLKGFIHADATIGTASTLLLDANSAFSKRVIVIVQNKSATATIEVRFAETGSVGLLVPPLSNISIDNYNGHVRAFSTAAGTLVHVAYSVV